MWIQQSWGLQKQKALNFMISRADKTGASIDLILEFPISHSHTHYWWVKQTCIMTN